MTLKNIIESASLGTIRGEVNQIIEEVKRIGQLISNPTPPTDPPSSHLNRSSPIKI
jgi:hypothetical protein